MRFCVGDSCRRTCAIDLHMHVQRGATVSSERWVHGGTVAPVRIDGYSLRVYASRDACNINASADACKFLSTRSLRDVSVLSACRSLRLLPLSTTRGRYSAFRRRIHNGRLFMVSVCVTVVVLICAMFLTNDQFSIRTLEIFN